MVVCLAITPMILFGLVGAVGMPLDIISAPAANVALPLGIDEMIHLGYALRRSGDGGENTWRIALSRLWAPILFSALIVGSGFALLLFSTFPPTRHLGVLVSVGAILTDLVVLIVLPAVVIGLGNSRIALPWAGLRWKFLGKPSED
jgi:predicted RND superfamily exporter protein